MDEGDATVHGGTGLVVTSMQTAAGLLGIRRAVRAGRLERVIRGVYARPGDRTRHGKYRIYAMAVGLAHPRSTVTGPAAAAIMGIGHLVPADMRVDVIAPGSKGRKKGDCVYRRDHPLLGETITVCGITVTPPARTAMEAAMARGARSGLIIAEAAMWRGLCAEGALGESAGKLAGRRGISDARLVAEMAGVRSQSVGESLVRWCIRCAGLPQPLQQVAIFDADGMFIGIVDFFWPELGVVIEFDGLVKTSGQYGDPVQVAREQLARQDRLLNCGLRVIRLRWEDAYRMACVGMLVAIFRERRGRGAEFTDRYSMADVAAMRR